jgi:hypothetical protein
MICGGFVHKNSQTAIAVPGYDADYLVQFIQNINVYPESSPPMLCCVLMALQERLSFLVVLVRALETVLYHDGFGLFDGHSDDYLSYRNLLFCNCI